MGFDGLGVPVLPGVTVGEGDGVQGGNCLNVTSTSKLLVSDSILRLHVLTSKSFDSSLQFLYPEKYQPESAVESSLKTFTRRGSVMNN